MLFSVLIVQYTIYSGCGERRTTLIGFVFSGWALKPAADLAPDPASSAGRWGRMSCFSSFTFFVCCAGLASYVPGSRPTGCASKS